MMARKSMTAALMAALLLPAVLLRIPSALAQAVLQNGRTAQQEAYRNWRQADPTLERDATSAGATLGARADKAAAEAAKFFRARKAYMESLAADAARKASLIEAVTAATDTAPNVESYLSLQNDLLGSSIETVARDPDRGIQQLRQAFERERTAIAGVTSALKDSRRDMETVAQTSSKAEQARAQIAEQYQNLAAGLRESEELGDQAGTAWATYYRALSDAARGVNSPLTSGTFPRDAIPGTISSGPTRLPAGPSSPTQPSATQPANPPGALPAGARSTGATLPSTTPAPAMSPAEGSSRSATAASLARYLGQWTYPSSGAHYHGAQPELVDLVVRNMDGQAAGSLSAQFRVAPGSIANPFVRLEFTGTFEGARVQRFTLVTSTGARGTLELIPGPAFNLLEVNFSIDDKPGNVRQANFLLVKK